MNILKIIKRVWNGLPLSDKNRWLMTRLLLEPILPFLKGNIIENAYLREKEWQSKRIRPFSGDPLPKLPAEEKPDIFIWAVIDWRYRIQRPQHLARGFAEQGHRVFYVSTSFINTRRPGFELENLDDAGRLYNVRFHLKGRPLIYTAPADQNDARRVKASIASLLAWTNSKAIISIVQHPYWHPLVRKLPNSRLIYDCLDHHEGFGNTGDGIASLEQSLLKEAEAVVTTSQSLYDIAATYNANVALIRNAAEYNVFSKIPDSQYRDQQGRRIIGYYGAIAHWMDLDLLEKLAQQYTGYLLLLVGADDSGVARQRLGHLPNVLFTGEVDYKNLPYYLYGMDVCLLPFQVTPLTLATNPLKIYEYLSAGKSVISVKLPELVQFNGLVATAETHAEFLAKVEVALAEPECSALVLSRRAFASQHSWQHRVADFKAVIDKLPEPLASVIVVTYNNLELTHACLESIEQYTYYENIEIIVIDNASTDGTPAYLTEWQNARPYRTVVLNSDNRGFAAANNQGLALAQGEYLVLLNNDTEVTPGWLRTLINHLRLDDALGLVGPITNNIGNEARINILYKNSEQMREKSRTYTLQHLGKTFPIRTLAFFCVMMPRHVYKKVGPLDEAFGLGFFEDDDYCRRVERAGWRLACAEDVFIHHHLSASFNKLGKGRQELLEKNRKVYEAKWGPWIPHQHRRRDSIGRLNHLFGFLPQEDMLRFRCNVCGKTTMAPLARVTREEATCRCGSSVRLRSLVHVLTLELFGESLAIGDIPYRPDLTGIDMSGAANYADRLAKRLRYTNTYLHKKPHLDITAPEQKWLSRCDFVISSDVFEHVAPPISRAFDNALRLLKPGGVFVFTVPYTKTGTTVEHFSDLHDYWIEQRGARRVLINNTLDNQRQEFEGLVFHGGEGETLEMRVFSESGVLEELRRAGFSDIRIHGESCPEFGILWPQQWSLPISARRPGA